MIRAPEEKSPQEKVENILLMRDVTDVELLGLIKDDDFSSRSPMCEIIDACLFKSEEKVPILVKVLLGLTDKQIAEIPRKEGNMLWKLSNMAFLRCPGPVNTLLKRMSAEQIRQMDFKYGNTGCKMEQVGWLLAGAYFGGNLDFELLLRQVPLTNFDFAYSPKTGSCKGINLLWWLAASATKDHKQALAQLILSATDDTFLIIKQELEASAKSCNHSKAKDYPFPMEFAKKSAKEILGKKFKLLCGLREAKYLLNDITALEFHMSELEVCAEETMKEGHLDAFYLLAMFYMESVSDIISAKACVSKIPKTFFLLPEACFSLANAIFASEGYEEHLMLSQGISRSKASKNKLLEAFEYANMAGDTPKAKDLRKSIGFLYVYKRYKGEDREKMSFPSQVDDPSLDVIFGDTKTCLIALKSRRKSEKYRELKREAASLRIELKALQNEISQSRDLQSSKRAAQEEEIPSQKRQKMDI